MCRLARLAIVVPIGITVAVIATAALIPLRMVITLKKRAENGRSS